MPGLQFTHGPFHYDKLFVQVNFVAHHRRCGKVCGYLNHGITDYK